MASSTVSQAFGSRVYAVGDMHGCAEEPEILLSFLEREQGLGEDDLVVFLGDYIDRGPNSRGVVDLVLDFKRRFPRTRFLKGNHEDMLLDFLGFGGTLGQSYLYNGGLETIQSYGMTVFSPPSEMVESMPPSHFKFYAELESIIEVDDYIFAHAGLNPLRDLYSQNDSDIMWIRSEFVNSIHNFGKTIVFGHTPHQEVFAHLPYKVGIDTGLVFGNKLTCLEVRAGSIFQIYRGEKEVVESALEVVQHAVAGEI